MADWYRVTLVTGGAYGSKVTFGAIGHPYSFTSASLERGAEVEWVFRCFTKPKGNETCSTLPFLPYELRQRTPDDVLRTDKDGWSPLWAEPVEEAGWYLSGVGHHELWCGYTLEEAVDAAQEHIAWDGQDPARLPHKPPSAGPDGRVSHRLPPETLWWEDEEYLWPLHGGGIKEER